MDRRRLSAVAHDGMTLWNPLGNAAAERIVAFAAHETGGRILDIGCGRADLILRTVERADGSGVGVDPWDHAIELARRTHSRRPGVPVRLVEAVWNESLVEPASFDVVMCVGSTHACGGYAGALDTARRLIKPGGRAVIGECHWLSEPAPEYLEVLGTPKDDLTTLDGLRDLAEAGGFTVRGTIDASRSERDAYETAWFANVERFVASHKYAKDGPELLETAKRWHDAYLRWGRTTLGFAVLLLSDG